MKRIVLVVLAMAMLLPASAGAAPGQPTTVAFTGATTGVWDDTVALSATLAKRSGPVAGEKLTFTLGSFTGTGTTDASGTATIQALLADDAGFYTLTASFAGAKGLAPSSTTAAFTIAPRPVTLSGQCTCNGAVGETMPVGVALRDDRNRPLSGRTVTVTLSKGDATGATKTLTTGQDGNAATTVRPNDGAGLYRLDWSFAGDGHYAPAQDAKTFELSARPTFLWYTGPTSAKSGTETTLSVIVYDRLTIQGVPNRPVVFTLLDVAGTTVGETSSVGDAGGLAIGNLMIDEAGGEYTLRISTPANATYEGSEMSVGFSVLRKMTFLGMQSAWFGTRLEGTTVSAQLTSEGQSFAGAPVTFRLLSPSGDLLKTAGAITDDTGTATATMTLDVPACVCTLEAVYAGDATHDPATATGALVVSKRPPAIALTSAPDSALWNDEMPVSARLVDTLSGAPIAGATVVFFISGPGGWGWPGPAPEPNASAITDENGIAQTTLRADVEPNTSSYSPYWVNVWFEGNDDYGFDFATRALLVYPRTAEVSIVESPFVTYRGAQVRYVAQLRDTARNAPIENAPLRMALLAQSADETLWSATAPTDADGRATIDTAITLPRGNYILHVYFEDARYFAWPATGAVTVGWQHTLADTLGRSIRLNLPTKEFRFDAPGDAPPDQTDPGMEITTLPGDVNVVRMDYRSDDISVTGVFETKSRLSKALIQTPKDTYAFV